MYAYTINIYVYFGLFYDACRWCIQCMFFIVPIFADPLEDLAAVVEGLFLKVTNRNIPVPVFPPDACTPEELGVSVAHMYVHLYVAVWVGVFAHSCVCVCVCVCVCLYVCVCVFSHIYLQNLQHTYILVAANLKFVTFQFFPFSAKSTHFYLPIFVHTFIWKICLIFIQMCIICVASMSYASCTYAYTYVMFVEHMYVHKYRET